MQVDYQGRKVEAKEVEVVTSKEEWNEYRLTNGRILMIKTVLIVVYEATDEKTPNGEPLYLTTTHQVIRIK
jgi:hypothetical protein